MTIFNSYVWHNQRVYMGDFRLIGGYHRYHLGESTQNRAGDSLLVNTRPGKHRKSYWKWPLSSLIYVDLPIDSMVIFHSYVNVYQRVDDGWLWKRPTVAQINPLWCPILFWHLGPLRDVSVSFESPSHGFCADIVKSWSMLEYINWL